MGGIAAEMEGAKAKERERADHERGRGETMYAEVQLQCRKRADDMDQVVEEQTAVRGLLAAVRRGMVPAELVAGRRNGNDPVDNFRRNLAMKLANGGDK
jgi:hypothetical protein